MQRPRPGECTVQRGCFQGIGEGLCSGLRGAAVVA